MRIDDMNWMQVEEHLTRDDRCVLPLGSTEQHAYLSLCVDNTLPSKLAQDAAEPLGVPVFPVLPYGITPYFRAYPGSVTLRVSTYLAVVRDLLDGLFETGFRRILIVNGHGGNSPAQGFVGEWMADHPEARVKFHNWWNAPRVWARVQETDPNASHASWMENFPWTRLEGVRLPDGEKPMADLDRLRLLPPRELRDYLGDGNYGGKYQRPDEDMRAIWDVAVQETRDLLEGGWGENSAPAPVGFGRGRP
ncbi:creatininase family protein [Deinococcus aestuarii]|uniref:creatininase family protein n=1 Tax=Deinococcus aestuarii TaxID=2774531 RepID=UPI001FE5FC03|nr:creatininase family protein [Deinococcus aestuarii]